MRGGGVGLSVCEGGGVRGGGGGGGVQGVVRRVRVGWGGGGYWEGWECEGVREDLSCAVQFSCLPRLL